MSDLIKTVSEVFPINMDFTNDLIVNETITSQITTLVDTANDSAVTGIIVSEVIVTPKVTLSLSGGEQGKTYKITTTITTSDTNVLTKSIILQVVDTIEASFNKIDTETILFKVEFADYLPTGDSISSVTATAQDITTNTDITSPFIVGASVSENTSALVKVTGGTLEHNIRILIQILTANSATLEANILAHIRKT